MKALAWVGFIVRILLLLIFLPLVLIFGGFWFLVRWLVYRLSFRIALRRAVGPELWGTLRGMRI
ncbi:MAG: hypothetical protein GX929_00085 [Clostridiales bacterium]|jgi:hypothetical protein|nr:hypothetical protein [Clostridiales bacterium]